MEIKYAIQSMLRLIHFKCFVWDRASVLDMINCLLPGGKRCFWDVV